MKDLIVLGLFMLLFVFTCGIFIAVSWLLAPATPMAIATRFIHNGAKGYFLGCECIACDSYRKVMCVLCHNRKTACTCIKPDV